MEEKISPAVVLECLRSVIKITYGTDMYVVGEGTGHAKFCSCTGTAVYLAVLSDGMQHFCL